MDHKQITTVIERNALRSSPESGSEIRGLTLSGERYARLVLISKHNHRPAGVDEVQLASVDKGHPVLLVAFRVWPNQPVYAIHPGTVQLQDSHLKHVGRAQLPTRPGDDPPPIHLDRTQIHEAGLTRLIPVRALGVFIDPI